MSDTPDAVSTAWQLRRATAADLAAIMALETSIFTTDAWSPATMKAELAGEQGYYLVAYRSPPTDSEAQNTIDAYAGLLAPHGAAEADIQTIAVAQPARRHGVGRALVAALLREAQARGAAEVFLEVRADNPGAQALYREFGFEAVGVRRHYYQPDDVDALVMRLATASLPARPVSFPERAASFPERAASFPELAASFPELAEGQAGASASSATGGSAAAGASASSATGGSAPAGASASSATGGSAPAGASASSATEGSAAGTVSFPELAEGSAPLPSGTEQP